MIRRPPRSPLFPSPPLFRSLGIDGELAPRVDTADVFPRVLRPGVVAELSRMRNRVELPHDLPCQDRKSTRLNSSHLVISYAVFCLKKKKNTLRRLRIITCVM